MTTFSHNNLSDVDANGVFFKTKVLQLTFPNVLMSTLEILEFVEATNCYPNASIAYRILLTMSVTVASMERSFSKLKLLKSYLRSSMSQERLNDSTILFRLQKICYLLRLIKTTIYKQFFFLLYTLEL